MKKYAFIAILFFAMTSCYEKNQEEDKTSKKIETPFVWENANIYFLLTDRFNNGDTSNDIHFKRNKETGILRGFEGGDIIGITKKIKDGYFGKLGINAIWLSPIVEQIHGDVDEGTGSTYAFHGYWTKDWTSLDPNFGTKEDLKKLVEIAHKNGIRIILDGVINHTGPVTETDPIWPEEWVRKGPTCEYTDYESTVTCTLTDNLPDIRTESNADVGIPTQLAEKWKNEGRYEQEMEELDAFFERTGYPKAPKYYIIKWLTDYITEFGIDGYRADTVKHIEESIWSAFKNECDYYFAEWKKNNPDKVLDSNGFFLVGEVYNYTIEEGKYFDFGDKKVNYFDYGFNSLINFDFKISAQNNYEMIFSRYSDRLHNELKAYSVLNYLTSHDDSTPFDKERTKPFESATKLLLSPGASQVYYGDESARNLVIEGATGDATLRGFMNWDEIENDDKTKGILLHWQKLGIFRSQHPSVGAGLHKMLSVDPYIFKRTYSSENYNDVVIVGLDLGLGKKEIEVAGTFEDGAQIRDKYSGKEAIVENGKVIIKTAYSIVLLEQNK